MHAAREARDHAELALLVGPTRARATAIDPDADIELATMLAPGGGVESQAAR
ncbi:hypothetical protein Q6348_01925 [Isoptericola sp. b441]|uniref:Uncharacterized protein n=1 Tax=Actinotalea lenta TaxID=3064654 RepID=A0ABT9D6G5_9CELL|nr:hypothetical protein [Isoptericola sp. b441]MDO8105951.1 hypothetical protein [Isoptericola sp. b441]